MARLRSRSTGIWAERGGKEGHQTGDVCGPFDVEALRMMLDAGAEPRLHLCVRRAASRVHEQAHVRRWHIVVAIAMQEEYGAWGDTGDHVHRAYGVVVHAIEGTSGQQCAGCEQGREAGPFRD